MNRSSPQTPSWEQRSSPGSVGRPKAWACRGGCGWGRSRRPDLVFRAGVRHSRRRRLRLYSGEFLVGRGQAGRSVACACPPVCLGFQERKTEGWAGHSGHCTPSGTRDRSEWRGHTRGLRGGFAGCWSRPRGSPRGWALCRGGAPPTADAAPLSLQMARPIQVKPADSESRGGSCHLSVAVAVAARLGLVGEGAGSPSLLPLPNLEGRWPRPVDLLGAGRGWGRSRVHVDACAARVGFGGRERWTGRPGPCGCVGVRAVGMGRDAGLALLFFPIPHLPPAAVSDSCRRAVSIVTGASDYPQPSWYPRGQAVPAPGLRPRLWAGPKPAPPQQGAHVHLACLGLSGPGRLGGAVLGMVRLQ